MRDLCPLHS
ncbi:rCG49028, partial [Rattus norvegicus]